MIFQEFSDIARSYVVTVGISERLASA